MIDLNGMSVFVAVAENGSLTAAANALNLPKSTVSRRLQSYEAMVGATLFRRSTRSISLTDVGQMHFKRVQLLIHEASDAVSELTDQIRTPSGLLRISASQGIGESVLAPIVCAFLQDYPQIRVEMILTDELVDLVADGIDFVLRMGDLHDSELMVKYLGKKRRILVASPKCLSQHTMPSKPNDLRRMPTIVTKSAQGFWHFENGEIVRVNWHIAAGTYRVAQEACLLGHGVTLLPEENARPFLEAGILIQLLPEFPLPEVSINLVYPRARHESAAARVFRTTLAQLKT